MAVNTVQAQNRLITVVEYEQMALPNLSLAVTEILGANA
jgi:hypothetical protein